MTNDKALVERLRNDAHMIQADGLGATLETAKQAADRICELITDIEAQAAEIERLREALREVRSCTGEHYGAARALKIISAALGEME